MNKANLRDLIAANGLVILLKLNSNHWFFGPCDLEIWWMNPKNNRAPLLHHVKLCASFQSHWWIQTGVTVRRRPILVKIRDFLSRVTLNFDRWPWKTIGHVPLLCYKLCASFHSHQWIRTGATVWKCPTGPIQVKIWFFVQCDLEIWWMTLKYNRVPLLCYVKLCTSFDSRWWIQTGVTIRKHLIRVKIGNFLSRVTLKSIILCPVHDLEIWQMTLKNNRAPLLCYFKLCASFCSHQWIKTRVTVQKRPIWVKISDFLCHVTLTFVGWPWNTIGHLSYATSSFVYHFIIIYEF